MDVKRLGTWLATLAIALHAAWPLIANAKPKSVHLVPLCTVEGVTHYLEVPGGSSPLDKSADAHHDHCSFCFLGMGGLLSSHIEVPRAPAVSADRIALDSAWRSAGFERSIRVEGDSVSGEVQDAVIRGQTRHGCEAGGE